MQNEREHKHKERIITLTNRRPVLIDESEWPIVARGTSRNVPQGGAANQWHDWSIYVRRHDSGRFLVYAVAVGRGGRSGECFRAGELLAPEADVQSAIRRVGHEINAPRSAIQYAISSLLAERI